MSRGWRVALLSTWILVTAGLVVVALWFGFQLDALDGWPVAVLLALVVVVASARLALDFWFAGKSVSVGKSGIGVDRGNRPV